MSVHDNIDRKTPLTNSEIAEAASEAVARIADLIHFTPLTESQTLSQGDISVHVKDETQQPSRTFKDRGACNAVVFHEQQGARLVVTASAGNHGKGLARAADMMRIGSLVVMSKSATREKQLAVAVHNANMRVHGDTFDEALELAQDLVGREPSRVLSGQFVHPFADPLVIAGQATIGLELLEQSPEMTHIVLPVGGGGLLAGVGAVIKEYRKDVKVIAAQVEGSDTFAASLEAGEPIQGSQVDSRFEGVAVGSMDPLTFKIGSRVVDQVILVTPTEVDHAVYDYRREASTLLERAGAVGPAAARKLANELEGQHATIVTVASGANPPDALGPYVHARAQRFGWDIDHWSNS